MKHQYLSNVPNQNKPTDDGAMPSDEEIEELFSKGKLKLSFYIQRPTLRLTIPLNDTDSPRDNGSSA